MILFQSYGELSVLETLQTYLHMLTPFAIFLLTAFILLRYANPIAAKLFPTEASAFPDDSVPTDQWYVFAFTVLGVVLLVWYVPVNIAICIANFLSIAGDSWGGNSRRKLGVRHGMGLSRSCCSWAWGSILYWDRGGSWRFCAS